VARGAKILNTESRRHREKYGKTPCTQYLRGSKQAERIARFNCDSATEGDMNIALQNLRDWCSFERAILEKKRVQVKVIIWR
jgi:hypothetical protein